MYARAACVASPAHSPAAFIRPRSVATLERLNLVEMCKLRPHNTNCYEVVSSISPGDFGAFLTVQSLPAVLDMFPSS